MTEFPILFVFLKLIFIYVHYYQVVLQPGSINGSHSTIYPQGPSASQAENENNLKNQGKNFSQSFSEVRV